MKDSNNALLPILALIVSTIGVASAIVFVKLSEVDATSTLMLRMFLAGTIASVIVVWPLERKAASESDKPSHNRRAIIGLLFLSGVVSAVDLLSNHWAARLTSLANTSILMNLSPVFVALISFLFMKEKISINKLLALTLSIAGACLLVFDGSHDVNLSWQSAIGDLLALNSALFYAIYLSMLKVLRERFSSQKIIIWNSFTCALILFPIALVNSPYIFPGTTSGWIIIILLAVISQLLGHGLMAYALRHVDLGLASVSTLARPVVTILLGLIIFDENLVFLQWIGVFVVLIGIGWYKLPVPVLSGVPIIKKQSRKLKQ